MSRNRFRRIYVEITNACNLSCSFCTKNLREPDFLTVEKFSLILDRIDGFTRDVYLHVLGEPLMHKNLNEILNLAKNRGFFIHITTNGTLLSQKLGELINNSVKWVNISLHSVPYTDRDRHTSWINTMLQSAENLAENGTCVALRMWQYSDSGELSELDALTMDILQKYFEINISDMAVGAVKVKNRLFLSVEKQFQWPTISGKGGTKGRCLGGVDMLAILVDGTVVPCCMDSRGEVKFGNIFSQTLDDILAFDRYISFYTGMKKCTLTEKLCQSCTYRYRFNN